MKLCRLSTEKFDLFVSDLPQAFREIESRPSGNNTLPYPPIDLFEPGDPHDEHQMEPTASTSTIPGTQPKRK